jgi:antitoxin YefM
MVSQRPVGPTFVPRGEALASIDPGLVLARVMSMTAAAEHMPLAEVKNRLSEVVDRLEREHGRVIITKHGRPAAVVITIEDLEDLEETLNVMSDPKLMRRVRQAQSEIDTGTATKMTKDEALALIPTKR